MNKNGKYDNGRGGKGAKVVTGSTSTVSAGKQTGKHGRGSGHPLKGKG